MLNLDTHILLGTIPNVLTEHEWAVLREDPNWAISGIVLWEIEMLKARNRIPHGLEHPVLRTLVRQIQVLPISVEVCQMLRTLDFHSDRADEIIAATSLAHNIPLVTRDAKIRTSKLVRFA